MMAETTLDVDYEPSHPGTSARTKSFNPAPRRRQRAGVIIAILCILLLLILNITAISLAFLPISTHTEEKQCAEKKKEVVAPLCVPCDEVGVSTEEGEEEEAGWRRVDGAGERPLCCPLSHDNLASALSQVYSTVLQEKQEEVIASPDDPYSLFNKFYDEPESTVQRVVFANIHKPSAHITGVQPYDADQYYPKEDKTNVNSSLQTVSDWPLRFEPYRSSTQGFVQRLTWGLVVPVSGLYRVHSTVNLYFSHSQATKLRLQETKPRSVVHQLIRYKRAVGRSTVLTQRNQTVSTGYTDGLTSFLTSVQRLEVGDVIAINLSHQAAMAMKDRWHSQGLFLLQ